ncbi:DUF389 domain-containing protein [Actinokineospora iranica]|uniref:DUF389 domain-containing protein n=1 Tax=Actinokineospora iranica TaxID=1271860 RepID=A0A1G6NGT9_9PSEU|nr:DUF389 domain-containing protein [Actinokineospora iranica]SDC67028.1 protein of unknown function [Actinokineospora iranica]
MLHLRVVCPTPLTEDALAVLRGHAGATHLVAFPGAAVDPAGDVLEADLAREAADEILGKLCGLGIDHAGGITLEQIDTALSDAADRAEEAAPGEAADAVVWEDLLARTGEESRLNVTYLSFLTVACLLAAVGVITDSPVTIVGAMVVGPEFGPLAALAVGHQVDFVYEVGPWSLIVAVLAGAAGMLSMTSAKSAALVGVFISVTTVPAAGYIGVAAILGEWAKVLGSAGQLAVNLTGIVLAAAVVLLLRRRGMVSGDTRKPLSEG